MPIAGIARSEQKHIKIFGSVDASNRHPTAGGLSLEEMADRRLQLPAPLAYALRWLVPCLCVALVSGLSSGLFLWALEWTTFAHTSHPWLLWLLPIAGLVSGLVYHTFGGTSDAGNNLILTQVREANAPVPLRMAPLVLGGTLLTHLFGGSAGREGTAVQMAGSLADQFSRPLRLTPHERRVLLRSAIAGGFAAVFGTPLAGTLFALEVVVAGSFSLSTLLPCLTTALMAHQVVEFLPIHHSQYAAGVAPSGLWPLAASALLGVAAGLLARLFAGSARTIAHTLRQHVSWPPLRPFLGGVVVAVLGSLFGSRFLGLGLPEIASSFTAAAGPLEAIAKLLLTVLTVGSGFKGGEVTPLFYIGSHLGSSLAPLLHLPIASLAAVGFVAVFAGATNTPLACTVMAMELFGSSFGPMAAVACLASWLASGPVGIYSAQTHAFRKGTSPSAARDDFL